MRKAQGLSTIFHLIIIYYGTVGSVGPLNPVGCIGLCQCQLIIIVGQNTVYLLVGIDISLDEVSAHIGKLSIAFFVDILLTGEEEEDEK